MKRFRLDIVGKLEDHPRLLRAYGRVPGAEVAWVHRPREFAALLVRITKSEATQWATGGDEVPLDWPRVRGRIEHGPTGPRAIVLDGALASKRVRLKTDRNMDDGEVLSVAIDTAKKTAVPVPVDAPRVPESVVDPADAVRAIKRLQLRPGRPGPVTFRGQWSGTLTIQDDGTPHIALQRKLASYGWLRITSAPTGWTWSFERLEKWFSPPATLRGESYATLMQAIDAGVRGALDGVQAACRTRDTHRRQALDADWAVSRPTPQPRPTKNPTERLVEPSPAPSKKPTPPRRRKPKKPRRSGAHTSARSASKTPSPAKDADLLAAFSEAIASALHS